MKREKKSLSARKRINEARARGAKRFYEGWWEEASPEERDRHYYNYLNDTYHFDDGPDDSYLDKYNEVWVHGYTKNIPLVVFEGGKKYLASYEYEIDGKLDANAEEFFQPADELSFISFDLYEFPKDGDVPANWDEKKAVKVATILENYKGDKARLSRITVANGMPVVEALKDQLIKGVEKAYYDETAEEYYPDHYDPEYDEIELNVNLVYKGELNKEETMKESTKKSSKKRLSERHTTWSKGYTYEVENELSEPLRVLSGEDAFNCLYTLECTVSYEGNDDEAFGDLDSFKILGCEFESVDSSDAYIYIGEADVEKKYAQEFLKGLVVVEDNKEVPFMDYLKSVAEDSIDAHAYEFDLDYGDFHDPRD